MTSASDVDASVRITNIMSPQRELDRDLDDHVDGRAQALSGKKSPLANGLKGPLVEAAAKSLQNANVANRSVTPHDDLENHFTGNPTLPRGLGVIGLHLAHEL